MYRNASPTIAQNEANICHVWLHLKGFSLLLACSCYGRPIFQVTKILILDYYNLTMMVVDVNNLKNGRKPVKLQKESPTGFAGEGNQSKGS